MSVALLELAYAVPLGIGATALMDLWALFQRRAFGVPSLNFAMVGRWIGHLPRGRFTHADIARTAPVRGEAALGWGAHYLIGIAFAAILLAAVGLSWLQQPSLLPPLLCGVLTVAAPFFVLQPALGLGVAASKTPRPWTARLRSLIAHAAFGIGLYLSAWCTKALFGL